MIEGINLELKSEYVEDIRKTVVAFANTEGGVIKIGISDDGTIVGVEDVDNVMLKVTNSIRDSIKPNITMFISCALEVIEDKTIIVISVQKGTSFPYFISSKGITPGGVYVRQGSSTVPASESMILRLIKEASNDNYEDNVSIEQELTFRGLMNCFKDADMKLEKEQMKSLGLLNSQDLYTNLAFLLSDQCKHSIKFAIIKENGKFNFKDRREIIGSLLDQLNDAYKVIDLYNTNTSNFESYRRIDRNDYPKDAIKEALLNAIVHREYSFSDSTLIKMFDDRLEIISLGGILKSVTLNDVMCGVSALRNRKLADIFYRLELIEAYGTGITKINKSYEVCNHKPRFEVTDNVFKVVLPNMNCNNDNKAHSNVITLSDRTEVYYKERFSNNEFNVINFISRNDNSCTRKELEDELNMSQATTIRTIKKLIDKELITKVGNGKNSLYVKR